MQTMTVHVNSMDERMRRVLDSCPSLSIPYEPPCWCSNAWLNVAVMMVRQYLDARKCPELRRETIRRPDGGEVSIDWYPSDLPSDAPVLGILHTITGSSRAQAGFMRYAAGRGWRCCVLNRRGHSGMPLRVPCFSLLGNVDDTIAMVDRIKACHPTSFIALAGVSAGSGAVVTYIGHQGDSTLINAAASLCPAWDLSKSFDFLLQTHPRMDRYILNTCKDFFLREPKNRAALAQVPNEVEAALGSSTMNEFLVASVPLAGSQSLEEYYKRNNPMQFAFANRTPCLVLNALDDFLCVKENIRTDLIDATENYILIITDKGSHIGYTEASANCGNYMWRITMDFFETVRSDRSVATQARS